MAGGTHIEWTDATWNPVGGCSIKSPGCTNCYAQGLAGTRLAQHPLYVGTTTPSKAGPVFNGHLTEAAPDADVWTWPLRWRGSKTPRLGAGSPSLIFVGDMADLFHEDRSRSAIDKAVAAILYSRHIGQFLTKRADVMRDYFVELRDSGRWVLFDHPILGEPNFAHDASFDAVMSRVWLGVSAEDQTRADERIPLLLDTPAAKRFVSLEPLLGPIELGQVACLSGDTRNKQNVLTREFYIWGETGDGRAPLREVLVKTEPIKTLPSLDWVIVGGESGPNARPMHPDWPRALRDQCQAAGVAHFFKQHGDWIGVDQLGCLSPTIDLSNCEWRFSGSEPEIVRAGKKAAGRLLDGVEHSEFPA